MTNSKNSETLVLPSNDKVVIVDKKGGIKNSCFVVVWYSKNLKIFFFFLCRYAVKE